MTGASQNGRLTAHPECLFDRFHWLYAFCRDHLFRDDTGRIAASLWTAGVPPAGSRLLELGCGPGFYARCLGEAFGYLDVTGVDRSELQLGRARMLAAAGSLDNCSFEEGDARCLPAPDASFDAVVISRLFVILPEPERVISEAHRVLKPGGRLFVAEPRSALRAAARHAPARRPRSPLRWSCSRLPRAGRRLRADRRRVRRSGGVLSLEGRALLAAPLVPVRRVRKAMSREERHYSGEAQKGP